MTTAFIKGRRLSFAVVLLETLHQRIRGLEQGGGIYAAPKAPVGLWVARGSWAVRNVYQEDCLGDSFHRMLSSFFCCRPFGPPHIQEALRLGAVDHLIKPFRYERFEEALDKVTVRRYLNYLIGTNEAESQVDYSTGGRPRLEYRSR